MELCALVGAFLWIGRKRKNENQLSRKQVCEIAKTLKNP